MGAITRGCMLQRVTTTRGVDGGEVGVVDIGCSSEATTDGEQVNGIVRPEQPGGRNWGAL